MRDRPGPDRLTEALSAAGRCAALCLDEALGAEDGTVAEAMRYALTGGKALRGFLALEGARLHGVPAAEARWAAGAIECLHAYSLIHDDLPAMDDDDLRRGRPTVHRAWDEATAILAGDALQAMAFGMLARPAIADAAKVGLVAALAREAGVRGMVGGQAMDIAAESAAAPLDLPQVERLQALKTGALIEWAAAAGPRMAGDAAGETALLAYGRALGRAFQIADDLLDATGDAAETGKAVGKDAGRGKATFVSLLGVEGARDRAAALVEVACEALSPWGAEADLLRDAARFVVTRRG
ncbi:polyprenyl synthetase family protein [Wenxinia saemankumensis]|uniref:Geranylgeranyl diphosphate synthase n=1 Tax=Wenxinia saemankumensis TaxID=1447782 RepID=A0A1M6FPZ3_9RHOB|nr:polyprenyl synthetase family protein [Wenxinia saemankumensis]SHI99740.1 farnesyl diphosphate synthase [Wenxinia saemankumensis]